MKKNPFIKIITVIILWIAAFSLIFGSAIMLLWNNTTEEDKWTQEIIDSEIIEENADDNTADEDNTIIEIDDNDIEIINNEAK